ncbi:ABC transporter permease [Falsiroseomonas sp.]|uniref:ABC transporter permease n=1 Tax=Falsiroseomonas sp. TaxID=2870721 RepID=UPI003566C28F
MDGQASGGLAERAMPVLEHDAGRPCRRQRAIADLTTGFARWRLAWALAWLDIRHRYRGSVLGPFWLTISTGAMVAGLGFIYSRLFRVEPADYLPHLAVSLVTWNLISLTVQDATGSLNSAGRMIRQLPMPFTVHALRAVLRNAIVSLHNAPLILAVFLLLGHAPGPEALLLPLGIALILVNAFAATMLLGMLCARFRDIGQIVASVMQFGFFMTPVLWRPSQLSPELQPLLLLNPFYTVLETVRGPLVEGGGPLAAWLAALLYTALLVVAAAAFFVRFRGRIAYWV